MGPKIFRKDKYPIIACRCTQDKITNLRRQNIHSWALLCDIFVRFFQQNLEYNKSNYSNIEVIIIIITTIVIIESVDNILNKNYLFKFLLHIFKALKIFVKNTLDKNETYKWLTNSYRAHKKNKNSFIYFCETNLYKFYTYCNMTRGNRGQFIVILVFLRKWYIHI